MYLHIEAPNDLKILALRIRTIKKEIGDLNLELTELREHAMSLGVKDLDEFESNFFNDD